eukprot:Gb_17542 [translate_table: standard]
MEWNGPISLKRKEQKDRGNDDSRLHTITEELDPWTAWAYRPHTISLLLVGACLLIWASGALNPEKPSDTDRVTSVKSMEHTLKDLTEVRRFDRQGKRITRSGVGLVVPACMHVGSKGKTQPWAGV